MRLNLLRTAAFSVIIAAAAIGPYAASAAAQHNVLLFVADGLRPGMVNPQNALTMAALLQRGVRFPNSLDILSAGKLVRRVMTDAMPNGVMPDRQRGTLRSAPDAAGLVTVVEYQTLGDARYFDAAGFPGRTLGLRDAR